MNRDERIRALTAGIRALPKRMRDNLRWHVQQGTAFYVGKPGVRRNWLSKDGKP